MFSESCLWIPICSLVSQFLRRDFWDCRGEPFLSHFPNEGRCRKLDGLLLCKTPTQCRRTKCPAQVSNRFWKIDHILLRNLDGAEAGNLPTTTVDVARQIIPHIDSALMKSRIRQRLDLYRLIPTDLSGINWEAPIGTKYIEKAYTSTSLAREKTLGIANGNRYLVLQIETPEIVHGIPIGDPKANQVAALEMEFLLPRNLKLEVIDKRVVEGSRVIFLRVVGIASKH
jgi:hypothetical protein